MMILGVDYHPSFQQIAFFMEETGECGERPAFVFSAQNSEELIYAHTLKAP